MKETGEKVRVKETGEKARGRSKREKVRKYGYVCLMERIKERSMYDFPQATHAYTCSINTN